MKCIFIYNPVGGRGKIEKRKEYILKELREKFEIVDAYATQCEGDMTRIAREAAQKYDVIVFSGGDGSFNELLQGIAELEKQPILGYIPSGTVNDMAHSLRIPSNLKKALKIVKTGRVEQIDCMKVNDRYAIYVAATGAFTSATYNTPQLQKNQVGRIAYGFEGIRHNLKIPSFKVVCKTPSEKVRVDGCVLIAFINSKYVAGFKMNPKANLSDGEIEVAIVERPKKANVFRVIGSYFSVFGLFLFGYRAKIRHILHLKGKSFEVELPNDLTWNLDGERGFNGKIRIEVVPKLVNILLPNKKR